MVKKSVFINEVGNKILIKIKKCKDTAKNYKTKEKFRFDAVNILIRGPTSEHENIITLDEAKKLKKLLTEFLREEY